MLYEKVLMKKTISGACKDLNEKQTSRFRIRQKVAHDHELNFRFGGYPIGKHTMQNMRNKYPASWRSGKCLCCGLPAYRCICKVEVSPCEFNKDAGKFTFVDVV